MNNILKNIGLSIILIIGGVILGYASFSGGPATGGTTNYDAIDVSDGYKVDGTTIIDGSGNLSVGTGAFSSTVAFNGLPTLNAGLLHSYTNSTSTTATTQTLLAADILNYATVIMDIEVGATTFTFPASSTLSAMVPVAGDRFEQCWYNATTTASQTITFAAGTGIDLEISTSSTNALTINPDGFNCFEYVRKPATATTFDIGVLMTHFDEGD